MLKTSDGVHGFMTGAQLRCLLVLIAGLGTTGLHVEASTCNLTQVPFCTWSWSGEGFFDFGDTGAIIDFQTLPNGAPSFGGAAITPAFNYVLNGALFSPALPNLFITGNSQLGYGLTAYNSNILSHNSIIAQLTNPERGVGVYVLDHTTLLAYDAQGTLITSVSHSVSNAVGFVGIKSSVPIASVVIDNGHNSVTIDDFTLIHIPAPEPASAAFLVLAAPMLFRRLARRSAARQ